MSISKNKYKSDLKNALNVIKNNGVAIVPTETVYGFITLLKNTAGQDRIYEIKERPKDKKFQIFINSLKMLQKVSGVLGNDLRVLAKNFWPGPLTIVTRGLNNEIFGFRHPKHNFIMDLIKQLNKPLSATSVNISGMPVLEDLSRYDDYFTKQVDIIVNHGKILSSTPSTVLSLLGDTPEILREGEISKNKIFKVLGLL